MKKILILVAGESNLPFIESAKQLGLYVITCDNNVLNPGHKIADESLFIDVYDHELIIETIKDKNIDCVMSFVSAHGLNSASIISEHFHLKGYTQYTLKTLINKALFRDFLSKFNLNFPAYQYVHNLDEINFEQLTYPVIIKPTDKGGSQGVIKINTKHELISKFQTSIDFSDSDEVIIEEFIAGEAMINGDCLIYNGEIICYMIGDYIYDNETNKVLPIATVFPTEHDISGAFKQILTIVKILNIPDGIINFEVIIKNNIPYIIEINPRPSGNYIWKLMGYKFRIDIPSLLINIYLATDNPKIEILKSNSYSYAYQLIYTDKNKRFIRFELPVSLEQDILDKMIFKQINEDIFVFKNLLDRVGLILMEFKDDEKRKFYTENINLFRI